MYKCPNCKNILYKGKDKRYETLLEHCSDPNKYYYSQPPLRETFVCRTKKCKNNKSYIFWDGIEGGAFVGRSWWQKILIKFNYYNFKVTSPDDAIFFDFKRYG